MIGLSMKLLKFYRIRIRVDHSGINHKDHKYREKAHLMKDEVYIMFGLS